MPGSSPHARGALAVQAGVRYLLGIIPACAGSTRQCRRCSAWRRDHPRMRGEHCSSCLALRVAPGSSPHARGAQHGIPFAVGNIGIIPACAGSTPRCCAASCRPGDHPRMRGEHAASSSCRNRSSGSSPHARGALLGREDRPAPLGIIPACAGSTRLRGVLCIHFWDHPRMRGEHSCSFRW